MPFVPLTPEEERELKPLCNDMQHSPPMFMVILHPCKWQCPSCGMETILRPMNITCDQTFTYTAGDVR